MPCLFLVEVLLKTLAVGICGSDIHYWHAGRHGSSVVREPMILGHETCAVVVAVGDGVKHLKPGDRVTPEPSIPCESCALCRGGKYNLCPYVVGHCTPPHHGSLTNFFLHHAGYTFKVPDSLSNEEAAMMEPLSVAVHSCTRAKVTVGSRVLITGSGPIGIYTLMAAKAFGAARVVLTDINRARLSLAKEVGADATILVTNDTSESETVDKIRVAFGGESPNISIECSGAPSSSRLVLRATESGGVVVQVGMGPAEIMLPLADAAVREVTILGGFRYKDCFPIAIDMAAAGRLQLSKLISHRFDFDDCERAFATALSGVGMKVIIKLADQ